MDTALIYLFFYAFLLIVDLIPLMKRKEKKVLYLSIPIFLLTLVINLMASFGVQFPALSPMIGQLVKFIFHMQ